MKLPEARNHNIVITELESELLIYDLLIDKAYCLNETSAIVFDACGNNQTFDDLRRDYKFTDDLIYFALDALQKTNLIENDRTPHFAGINRREVIRRVGFGTMIALPVISAIAAPLAAQAASLLAVCQTCSNNSQCANGNQCASNLVAPFGNLCTSGTSGFTFPAGFVARGPFSEPDCAQFGRQSCCSGGASRNASADCVCNS